MSMPRSYVGFSGSLWKTNPRKVLTARSVERHAKIESKQGKLKLAVAQAAICHEPLDARLLRLALQEAPEVLGC